MQTQLYSCFQYKLNLKLTTMGVITTWDEQRDTLEESIVDAKKALMQMIDPDTWGHSDIRTDSIIMYEELYIRLCQIHREIQ